MVKPSQNPENTKFKWDSQLRKGLLDYIILLFLNKKEYYGYELIRDIKQVTDIQISEGTIYPLLNRLRKELLITSQWVEMETGIPRKYYQITDKGITAVEQMKTSWDRMNRSINNLLEWSCK